jgi:hypothetical protein
MNEETNEKRIAHLGFIQGVITRMAGNLFYLRGWVITLVAGILVLLTKIGDGKLPIIFLSVIIVIFWGYDGYFLALERRYRDLYDKVRKMKEEDIDFSMKIPEEIEEKKKNSIVFCIFSSTLRYFYGLLLLAALYVIFFIK